MSATVPLDELLQEVVSVPSRNLVTRPTGAAVRDRLLLQLRGMDGDARLDFSRVGVVDFSCADEVVAKLLAMLEDLPVNRVLLTGLHPHHADAIDLALDRQGMTVMATLDAADDPCLLGAVPADCAEVFRALLALGRATGDAIAAQLGWPGPRVDDALGDLVRRRCALALPDASFVLGAFP